MPTNFRNFRFILISLHNGCIQGTDDLEQAEHLAKSDENFVYDIEERAWLMEDENGDIIKEEITEVEL
jgi:hypothetical protein